MHGKPPKAWLTTNIVGGLGNQLFLIANLLATARRCNVQPVLPPYPFSSSQDEPRPTYWQSIFEDLPIAGVVQQAPPSLHEVVIPERRPVAPVRVPDPAPNTLYNLVGFFQSDAFFKDYPFQISSVPSRLRDLARRMLVDNYLGTAPHSHTAALHIRRGDYLKYADTFATLDMTYYDTAIRQLFGHQLVVTGTEAAPPGPIHLLIFCEDEKYGDFAVGYLRSKYRGLQVSLVHPKNEPRLPLSEGNPLQPRDVVELLMMAQCNDVVMANSTFSWWGAYLNETPLHRTVAPSQWFVKQPYPQSNHLYCDDWIIL